MEPDGESVVLWGVIVSVVHLNGQFYRSGLSLWMYVEFEIGELLGGLGIIYGSP